MIIKALKTFSDGAISMHEGEIAKVPDAKAQLFIAEGYAEEYSEPFSEADLDNVTIKKINGLVGTVNTRITGRYNVLDYGLKNNGTTDNTNAFREMLETIPAGAIVYFPQGSYKFNDTVEINKSISLVGESKNMQVHSGNNTTHAQTEIVFATQSGNKSLFERTTIGNFFISNITFHSTSYSQVTNSADFSALPYNMLVPTITLENVNCINASAYLGGDVEVRDCVFKGFSGYAIAVVDHIYIKNCGFYMCGVGVKYLGSDGLIENCWICNGDIGILATCEKWGTFANLSVSDCWCDQMASHFIKTLGASNNILLLVNNAWVDMIDKAGIYVEGNLNNSMISGRFSRCGMMYAGIEDSARTAELKPLCDAIVAKRIYNSKLDITIAKRVIGKGNNANGVCPSRAVSSTDDYKIIANTTITCADTPISDILESTGGSNVVVNGRDYNIVKNNLFEYTMTPILFRTSAPTGSVQAPREKCLCINTATGDMYFSSGIGANTTWELIVNGDKASN